ncbi:protein suppressor of sable isoform X2 [Plodia interpunctella]|uniref:protein suppressor of sable isoform X2 n=1 Tax=Plodia interpunctella TaxID=58824 RepID=UPI002367DD9A|nr:protein suppressor of sable isoform X2 [Plodia interpunctella]
MLIVPTNISDTFIMADAATNLEDLEDGEIESDGEDASGPQAENKQEDNVQVPQEKSSQENMDTQEFYYSKSGKKKKNKSKGEQKFKDKNKKKNKYSSPTIEEDFAGNIEKAIRKAMNKNDEDSNVEEDVEDRRKHKKRKKYDNKDGLPKKRKKQEYSDEMDEDEMMCVRGASPVQKPLDSFGEDDRDSYASDSSHESREQQHQRAQRKRPQRERNKNHKNDRRRVQNQMQDGDGVCSYYMQGKCHKGDDCIYSHDAQPPRKMELCKFYLMDCCAKRDKCLYMHADFPCKYYHTGLPCIFKDDCKFAHGKPLTENLKNILLKHIESAPKEILGDFPRLHREGALQMIQATQLKLMQQYSENTDNDDKTIPSLFDLNIQNPQNVMDNIQSNQFNNERQNKVSPKIRQSRWQHDNTNQNFNINMSPNSSVGTTNVLSIKNLTGVLTPRQISDLTKMGIDNLDQLGQLTVLQLNSIGISLKQITEIQLNTMNIQKLGLINPNNEQTQLPFATTTSSNKDLDLRVPPVIPISNNATVSTSLPGQDVDMRFQTPSLAIPSPDDNSTSNIILKKEPQANKDMIDIDQYTKDALKFALKDKENIDVSNDTYESENSIMPLETKDVDHRVLPFTDENLLKLQSNIKKELEEINSKTEFDTDIRFPTMKRESEDTVIKKELDTDIRFGSNKKDFVDNTIKKEFDTDIRFLQPEPIFKNSEKKHRRSTTDDEDNLLIDEKWYSSDEEKGIKRKSPVSSPKPHSQSPLIPAPHVIEPSSVLSRIGDLSKIDISEEVTKLLNTMKNNLQEPKSENIIEQIGSPKSRDPRSRKSPDRTSDTSKISNKKPTRISIYECVDGEPTDGRRRTDVDLRQSEFKLPTFGDTDLRQTTSGDIDFRISLPFKPINNYTPATEINGSINSHPPIPYKLIPIDIPRPDYTDIRDSTAKSQALIDPRLRKVFRLSIEESNSDSEKTSKPVTPAAPRVDPRRKPKDISDVSNPDQKSSALELQNILQNSNWYKDLSSTQKIFVNQHLAPVVQIIKQYQQEKATGKKLDLTFLQSNTVLCSIFTNLGVSLGDNGEFSYIPKPKEALLKTPINFNQNQSPFGMNNMPMMPGSIDGNNTNMMNIPGMGMGGMNNMNVGPMHNYNQPMTDPRGGPAPGLLGIAPNIPHNFSNNNFGGPSSFGNMGFNGPGPGNDFNFMDGEQNFPRFPNRGGHRGRGNDRWNRGGSGRGHRDRKNFNDRGGWKK